MAENSNENTCLASQSIRRLVNEGVIKCSYDEGRIQPSSFEPTIGDKVFVLDTEDNGVFRPEKDKTIYQMILDMPIRQRQSYDTRNGYELKKGYTYLIPLNEKIKMPYDFQVKSSPKSSLGRLFIYSRLLADFDNRFDEISKINYDDYLNLWLLVQPLAFNVIIHPGLSMNQLRFSKGGSARLSDKELSEYQLLFNRSSEMKPLEQIFNEGLEIRLDVSGRFTKGIVGLCARNNPTPIDLKIIDFYEAEDFFEPIFSKENYTIISSNKQYLFSSSGVLKIPDCLSVELKSHDDSGFNASLHYAGFIDPGFNGDLVFEITSNELSKMQLVHDMAISKLIAFRTEKPDKDYGKGIGSHYNLQVGPKPSKYFKEFDFSFAAKEYKRLNRKVLVHDAEKLLKFRDLKEGFEEISEDKKNELFDLINKGFFHYRYDCEHDPLVLQPSCYILIFGPENKILSYIRADNIEDFGDRRLFGKHSIGFGGHMNVSDGHNYVKNSMERELWEELGMLKTFPKAKFLGTLMAFDKPVDAVHFGLVFKIHTSKEVVSTESSVKNLKYFSIDDLLSDDSCKERYETWSWRLIPHLKDFYNN